MPRLTKAESREQTRARLLDAAERAFAENGYAATSLEAIAEAAGYTRGAVYYNFAGKDELFIAVRRRRNEADVAAVAELMTASEQPERLLEALRERSAQRSAKDIVRWAQLAEEFWLYATRNSHARRLLADHQRQVRAAYADGIQTVLNKIGAPPPAPVEHLAAAILALDQGLSRQRLMDPDGLPETIFYDTIGLLIRAAQSLHQTSG